MSWELDKSGKISCDLASSPPLHYNESNVFIVTGSGILHDYFKKFSFLKT